MAPLQNGDHVHFHIRLREPGYIRLLWVDADGEPMELLPLDPELKRTVVQLPLRTLTADSPVELDKGWPISGNSGFETAVLLVSRQPLPELPLEEFRSARIPAGTQPSPTVFTATRTSSAVAVEDKGQTRSITPKSEQIDDSVLQLLERIRKHADVTQAVVIPHGGDADK